VPWKYLGSGVGVLVTIPKSDLPRDAPPGNPHETTIVSSGDRRHMAPTKLLSTLDQPKSMKKSVISRPF
jgi:hypothetical protein